MPAGHRARHSCSCPSVPWALLLFPPFFVPWEVGSRVLGLRPLGCLDRYAAYLTRHALPYVLGWRACEMLAGL